MNLMLSLLILILMTSCQLFPPSEKTVSDHFLSQFNTDNCSKTDQDRHNKNIDPVSLDGVISFSISVKKFYGCYDSIVYLGQNTRWAKVNVSYKNEKVMSIVTFVKYEIYFKGSKKIFHVATHKWRSTKNNIIDVYERPVSLPKTQSKSSLAEKVLELIKYGKSQDQLPIWEKFESKYERGYLENLTNLFLYEEYVKPIKVSSIYYPALHSVYRASNNGKICFLSVVTVFDGDQASIAEIKISDW